MSAANPLVTVIVTVYNGEEFLGDAIRSILAQTYEPVDLLLINDGSTDGTAEIARSFGELIRYHHVDNCGIARVRNRALELVKGDLIAFLDADDLWPLNKLSVQVRHLMEHPEIQYSITRMKYFVHENSPVPKAFRRELLQGNHVGRIVSTLLARRSVFDSIGKFNPDLVPADDVDWFARAADLGVPMAILPDVLLHKRVHEANSSHQVARNNIALLKLFRESIHRKRRTGQEGDSAKTPLTQSETRQPFGQDKVG
jgi:glycosyltransferase involved in cell wall biosynthesis